MRPRCRTRGLLWRGSSAKLRRAPKARRTSGGTCCRLWMLSQRFWVAGEFLNQQHATLRISSTCCGKSLCILECRGSNDFLLPMLMTFLNSPDWQLRADLFSSIALLGQYAGPAGTEACLLPCVLQVARLLWRLNPQRFPVVMLGSLPAGPR